MANPALHAQCHADINLLLTELGHLREALEFYADPKHWESIMVEDYGDGHQTWESGAAVDGGARARAVLVFRTTYNDGGGA